ncbi:retrovirus-related pol polyprotein from transposon TNT 1-94, partial [Tanacetum coccineum]
MTNIPVLPSTGVNDSTEASGSKPRSNTKKNRILPAKKENKKEVDSSISSKRVVINSNSESVNSASHGMCVVNILNSVNATPTVRIVLNKEKQIWKPKGKLSDNSLNKTKQIWKPKDKLSDNSLYKTQKDLVRGLPRLKFEKDHLCSACQLGKSKKFSLWPKSENTNMEVLHTLHMDLCGPMRVQSIKGKKYILVIVDDYSRFTWVKFLRSKDETPEFVTNFLKQIQVGLNKTVRFIRTDNGTEFVNQVMSEYYEGVGIFHQKSVPRTPQQNGVVERRNRTLVEAARTMMIFSKAPMFLWAEAVATACYTQNRSLIHTRHNKTPYELVHDKKPDLTFFRVFGALCYPANDSENLGKFQAKADIGIFVGYAPSRKGYRIYNKRTRRLMETIHVTFDEMHQSMAPARMSSGPEPVIMNPGQLKTGLAPTDKELEMLFQPMFDEHLEQSRVNEPVPSATEINAQVVLPEEPIQEDTPPIIHDVLHPSHNLVTGDPGSAQSSSGNVNATEPNQVNYPPDHLRRWTKDHPLDNIVGNPSRPVSTRKQLASDA